MITGTGGSPLNFQKKKYCGHPRGLGDIACCLCMLNGVAVRIKPSLVSTVSQRPRQRYGYSTPVVDSARDERCLFYLYTIASLRRLLVCTRAIRRTCMASLVFWQHVQTNVNATVFRVRLSLSNYCLHHTSTIVLKWTPLATPLVCKLMQQLPALKRGKSYFFAALWCPLTDNSTFKRSCRILEMFAHNRAYHRHCQ